jgi:hypothetical protein
MRYWKVVEKKSGVVWCLCYYFFFEIRLVGPWFDYKISTFVCGNNTSTMVKQAWEMIGWGA